MLRSILTDAQTGKAEHRGLPEPAKGSGMNAAGGVSHVVCQVDLCRLPKIPLGTGHIAKARRYKGVNGWAQGAPMPAARLIVIEIGLADLWRKSVPEEID